MKIKITYQEGDNIEGVLVALSPFIKKVSYSDRHAPYLHVYLTLTSPSFGSKSNR